MSRNLAIFYGWLMILASISFGIYVYEILGPFAALPAAFGYLWFFRLVSSRSNSK